MEDSKIKALEAAGWRRYLDPKSHDFFYYNQQTGETLWDMPCINPSASTVPAAAVPLSPSEDDSSSSSKPLSKLQQIQKQREAQLLSQKKSGIQSPSAFLHLSAFSCALPASAPAAVSPSDLPSIWQTILKQSPLFPNFPLSAQWDAQNQHWSLESLFENSRKSSSASLASVSHSNQLWQQYADSATPLSLETFLDFDLARNANEKPNHDTHVLFVAFGTSSSNALSDLSKLGAQKVEAYLSAPSSNNGPELQRFSQNFTFSISGELSEGRTQCFFEHVQQQHNTLEMQLNIIVRDESDAVIGFGGQRIAFGSNNKVSDSSWILQEEAMASSDLKISFVSKLATSFCALPIRATIYRRCPSWVSSAQAARIRPLNSLAEEYDMSKTSSTGNVFVSLDCQPLSAALPASPKDAIVSIHAQLLTSNGIPVTQTVALASSASPSSPAVCPAAKNASASSFSLKNLLQATKDNDSKSPFLQPLDSESKNSVPSLCLGFMASAMLSATPTDVFGALSVPANALCDPQLTLLLTITLKKKNSQEDKPIAFAVLPLFPSENNGLCVPNGVHDVQLYAGCPQITPWAPSVSPSSSSSTMDQITAQQTSILSKIKVGLHFQAPSIIQDKQVLRLMEDMDSESGDGPALLLAQAIETGGKLLDNISAADVLRSMDFLLEGLEKMYQEAVISCESAEPEDRTLVLSSVFDSLVGLLNTCRSEEALTSSLHRASHSILSEDFVCAFIEYLIDKMSECSLKIDEKDEEQLADEEQDLEKDNTWTLQTVLQVMCFSLTVFTHPRTLPLPHIHEGFSALIEVLSSLLEDDSVHVLPETPSSDSDMIATCIQCLISMYPACLPAIGAQSFANAALSAIKSVHTHLMQSNESFYPIDRITSTLALISLIFKAASSASTPSSLVSSPSSSSSSPRVSSLSSFEILPSIISPSAANRILYFSPSSPQPSFSISSPSRRRSTLSPRASSTAIDARCQSDPSEWLIRRFLLEETCSFVQDSLQFLSLRLETLRSNQQNELVVEDEENREEEMERFHHLLLTEEAALRSLETSCGDAVASLLLWHLPNLAYRASTAPVAAPAANSIATPPRAFESPSFGPLVGSFSVPALSSSFVLSPSSSFSSNPSSPSNNNNPLHHQDSLWAAPDRRHRRFGSLSSPSVSSSVAQHNAESVLSPLAQFEAAVAHTFPLLCCLFTPVSTPLRRVTNFSYGLCIMSFLQLLTSKAQVSAADSTTSLGTHALASLCCDSLSTAHQIDAFVANISQFFTALLSPSASTSSLSACSQSIILSTISTLLEILTTIIGRFGSYLNPSTSDAWNSVTALLLQLTALPILDIRRPDIFSSSSSTSAEQFERASKLYELYGDLQPRVWGFLASVSLSGASGLYSILQASIMKQIEAQKNGQSSKNSEEAQDLLETSVSQKSLLSEMVASFASMDSGKDGNSSDHILTLNALSLWSYLVEDFSLSGGCSRMTRATINHLHRLIFSTPSDVVQAAATSLAAAELHQQQQQLSSTTASSSVRSKQQQQPQASAMSPSASFFHRNTKEEKPAVGALHNPIFLPQIETLVSRLESYFKDSLLPIPAIQQYTSVNYAAGHPSPTTPLSYVHIHLAISKESQINFCRSIRTFLAQIRSAASNLCRARFALEAISPSSLPAPRLLFAPSVPPPPPSSSLENDPAALPIVSVNDFLRSESPLGLSAPSQDEGSSSSALSPSVNAVASQKKKLSLSDFHEDNIVRSLLSLIDLYLKLRDDRMFLFIRLLYAIHQSLGNQNEAIYTQLLECACDRLLRLSCPLSPAEYFDDNNSSNSSINLADDIISLLCNQSPSDSTHNATSLLLLVGSEFVTPSSVSGPLSSSSASPVHALVLRQINRFASSNSSSASSSALPLFHLPSLTTHLERISEAMESNGSISTALNLRRLLLQFLRSPPPVATAAASSSSSSAMSIPMPDYFTLQRCLRSETLLKEILSTKPQQVVTRDDHRFFCVSFVGTRFATGINNTRFIYRCTPVSNLRLLVEQLRRMYPSAAIYLPRDSMPQFTPSQAIRIIPCYPYNPYPSVAGDDCPVAGAVQLPNLMDASLTLEELQQNMGQQAVEFSTSRHSLDAHGLHPEPVKGLLKRLSNAGNRHALFFLIEPNTCPLFVRTKVPFLSSASRGSESEPLSLPFLARTADESIPSSAALLASMMAPAADEPQAAAAADQPSEDDASLNGAAYFAPCRASILRVEHALPGPCRRSKVMVEEEKFALSEASACASVMSLHCQTLHGLLEAARASIESARHLPNHPRWKPTHTRIGSANSEFFDRLAGSSDFSNAKMHEEGGSGHNKSSENVGAMDSSVPASPLHSLPDASAASSSRSRWASLRAANASPSVAAQLPPTPKAASAAEENGGDSKRMEDFRARIKAVVNSDNSPLDAATPAQVLSDDPEKRYERLSLTLKPLAVLTDVLGLQLEELLLPEFEHVGGLRKAKAAIAEYGTRHDDFVKGKRSEVKKLWLRERKAAQAQGRAQPPEPDLQSITVPQDPDILALRRSFDLTLRAMVDAVGAYERMVALCQQKVSAVFEPVINPQALYSVLRTLKQ